MFLQIFLIKKFQAISQFLPHQLFNHFTAECSARGGRSYQQKNFSSFTYFPDILYVCFYNFFELSEGYQKSPAIINIQFRPFTAKINDKFLTFSAWCPLKGHTYSNKPAAFSCVLYFSSNFQYVWPFSGHQALKG